MGRTYNLHIMKIRLIRAEWSRWWTPDRRHILIFVLPHSRSNMVKEHGIWCLSNMEFPLQPSHSKLCDTGQLASSLDLMNLCEMERIRFPAESLCHVAKSLGTHCPRIQPQLLPLPFLLLPEGSAQPWSRPPRDSARQGLQCRAGAVGMFLF